MSNPIDDSILPSENNLLAALGLSSQSPTNKIEGQTKQRLIDQGYELGHEPLGKGGSALVFPAVHTSSGNKVAVKIILNPSIERHYQEFIREQRVLASEYIPSEIVPKFIHSIDSDDAQPCLIMERINGIGILEFAKQHQLSIADRVDLTERIFEAYRSLHACNLVHGDPSHKNILIEPGNRVRLIDFGISRRAQPGYESIHSVVGASGTPSCAPESQLTGEEVRSTQTDMQAVSAIAYWLLAGTQKLEGAPSKNESQHRQVLLDAQVPARIADIILQGMRETPLTNEEQLKPRFKSCNEVLEAFENTRALAARTKARRRQAIVAVTMLVPLIAAFWWGYSQFLEVRRIQQQQTISMLQQEISKIVRQTHPAVATGLQTVQRNLDAYHQAEQSQDATRVATARGELVQSMRSVLDLSRSIDRSIPIREALGVALEKMPWVESSTAIQRSRDDLAQEYLAIGMQIDHGEVANVDSRLGALQSGLAELANRNAQAQSAIRSRTDFANERTEVPARITEQSAFNAVAVLADSAEGAWQEGDFKHAATLFLQAKQKLNEVVPQLETEDETRQRAERRTSRLSEEILALRQQIEETRTQRDESDRKTRELESRIASISSQASLDRENAATSLNDLKTERMQVSQLTQRLAEATSKLASQQPDADAYGKLKPIYDQMERNLKDAKVKIAALERARALFMANKGTAGNTAIIAQEVQQLNDLQKRIDGLDQTDSKAALDALRDAYTKYSAIERLRRDGLREYRDNSPTIRAIDVRLAESSSILKSALQAYDRAQDALHSKLETEIETLRSERTRRIEVDGLLETATAIRTIDEQGKKLVQEKSKYSDSHKRLASGSDTQDVAETVKQLLGDVSRDVGQAGESLVAKISGMDVPFRYCPPCAQGTFLMGSPQSEAGRSSDEKQVSVVFNRGFYMMETECWNALWSATMQDNKGSALEGLLPVVNVSYDECQTFVQRANQALQIPVGARMKLRLPTEAQWEYACRAGTKTRFSFGDSDSQLKDYAWFSANLDSKLHPVGTKKPNPWGLKDMHGSVWEWTADRYASEHTGGLNPMGPASGAFRVYRGGSAWGDPGYCRSANRRNDSPDYRNNRLGFRLALEFSQN